MEKAFALAVVLAGLACWPAGAAPVAAAAAADASAPKAKAGASDPAARQRMVRERIRKRYGGWVRKPGTGSGTCGFVNAQKAVPRAVLEKVAAGLADALECDVLVKDAAEAATVASAGRALRASGLMAAVIVVDDPSLPMSLVADEGRWALLNVAPLLVDAPEAGALSVRAEKQCWRTFARLCGASDCPLGNCALRPLATLRELDGMKTIGFCPEALVQVDRRLRAIGVTPHYRTTYRDACQKGWAPPPADEWQKAIWDEFHAAPSTPLTIRGKNDAKPGAAAR